MRNILFWEALVLGALCLYLARSYTAALYLFLPLYFFLVWHVVKYEERQLYKLAALSMLTAVSLALRFDYLVWGDPWADYAIAKHILETKQFPLTDEEPLARFIVVMVASLSNIDVMAVQKFLIPALGSLAAPTLYIFMQDFMPKRNALYSALLLTVATPYLHWVTQGVRESLGLFTSVLALYLSYDAVKTQSPKKFAGALLSIALAVLSHPRAGLMFVAAWLGFSSFYVSSYPSRKRIASGAFLTLFAIGFSLRWWEITSSRGMSVINQFLSTYGIGFSFREGVLIGSIVAMALLKFTPAGFIARNKKPVYGLGLAVGIVVLAYAINILGRSFALPYPTTYYINGAVMVSLSIVGLYYLLEKEKIPLVGWVLGVFLLFLFNILLTRGEPTSHSGFPLMDPFRFTEFITIPLAAFAGMGFLPLEKNATKLLPAFIALSLVAGLPSMVFLGMPFAKGDLLYDERSWLISHPEQEMAGIKWLGTHSNDGGVVSDLYISYSLSYIGRGAALDRTFSSSGYKLITERMNRITDFGELTFLERGAITEEIRKLGAGADKVYTNGYAHIYQ